MKKNLLRSLLIAGFVFGAGEAMAGCSGIDCTTCSKEKVASCQQAACSPEKNACGYCTAELQGACDAAWKASH